MSPSTASLPSTEGAYINLRTSPEAKALIELAAALLGTTVSAFLLQHAYGAALQVVAANCHGNSRHTPSEERRDASAQGGFFHADDTLILSQQAFDAFVAACENPSEQPSAELRRLLHQDEGS